MGVVLIGTVQSTYRVLETLIDLKAPIDMVLSLSPADASGISDYVDLRPLSEAHGVPHRYFKQVNSPEILELLQKIQPDVIFVIGLSQLISSEILRIPRYGCVGAHPALLPRNRGRAVIPWTIIREETFTGMTLFYIDEGIDSGDIIDQVVFPISDEDTAQTIYDRAVEGLCFMLRKHFHAILAGTAPRKPQDDSKASYCARRRPEDGLIDWTASTRTIYNLIRAVTRPYPGAFTYYGTRRVTIWSAVPGSEEWAALPGQILRLDPLRGALVKTGDGTIWLTEIEVDGQPMLPVNAFRRVGEKLGVPDTATLLHQIKELEKKINKLEVMIK